MTVRTGGWALFECENCGGQFAALVTPCAKVYCTNCAKMDIFPENIQLAKQISFITDSNS